ncbi:MAG: DUF6377 domain-containing protein [Dysgonomonas sp.]|nr:DUF6377 domain-containing protein [Dysgonomonas sp.]
MKTFIFILSLSFISITHLSAKSELDSLFAALDNKIKSNDIYIELKNAKIEDLKAEKLRANTPDKLYSINSLLYKEYRSFISDSAISYLNQNLDIAFSQNDIRKINETSIASGSLFSMLGMYKEAADVMQNVIKEYLDKSQMIEYYNSYGNLYSGLGQYTQNVRERGQYWSKSNAYRDSVSQTASHDSEEYLKIEEILFRQEGKIKEALEINDKRLAMTKIGTPIYALVTFNRSLLYRRNGDLEMEKKYLILSAISDIQCAIKDNASIPILANMLMQEGDINRAYRYVRFSLDNINDYNTRIRSSEILNIQAIIDKAYQKKNDEQKRQLRVFLILISILSVLLAISAFYAYKQMRKGILISKRQKETNLELNDLNQKLHNMNNELRKINYEVVEANHIKEEYIGYFLDQCSKYIEKLDDYRKMVNKRIQAKEIENLYKTTKNNDLKENELKELFSNFDIMFTHLFPDFIEKFNALLQDGEQIILKKGEVLNNELRIYALIRLGIDDSGKIANFLGYSVNTIYNYRTKTRNKAKISREDFEWMVKKIGTFKK